eukprot:TRINITY_DN1908_c0_g1_i2.p1 TRINITY_DN1908_c0_g1~~TRINITY_DN1908_c0_g1_i2.p1  ORF type:complete len:198 (-),score=18.70 TRINITY_DN1908_c0_g1_i2:634-1227(-)
MALPRAIVLWTLLAPLAAAFFQCSTAKQLSSLPKARKCAKSTLKGYYAMVTLTPGMLFHFKVNGTTLHGAIEARNNNWKKGWLAVGFSKAGKMTGADAIIGNLAVRPAVGAYYMGGIVKSAVKKTTKFVLTKTSVAVGASGATIVKFTRSGKGGTVPVKYAGVNYLIWAHAPANTKVLDNHGPPNRGAWAANFACKV